jgi:hypothetical protein
LATSTALLRRALPRDFIDVAAALEQLPAVAVAGIRPSCAMQRRELQHLLHNLKDLAEATAAR